MKRHAWLVLLLSAATATLGCVERRYLITSDPPGALVYVNNVPIGTTPVDGQFVYYGAYDFTLVKDGYATLHEHQNIPTPWYEYLVPYKFRDSRTFSYQLVPVVNVRQDDVLKRATELRVQGQAIGPPKAVVPPPPQPTVAPGPTTPAPGQLPPSAPAPVAASPTPPPPTPPPAVVTPTPPPQSPAVAPPPPGPAVFPGPPARN
jgi:hypothetical protein